MQILCSAGKLLTKYMIYNKDIFIIYIVDVFINVSLLTTPCVVLPHWAVSLRDVEWVHDLFLFPPCFRENEVATCKIGSFLCSLDNLLQKHVIVFFFGNLISKWRSFEKRAIFHLLFTFFSYQGKVTKIPSAHISLTYIHVFCSPYWLFFALPILKKIRIYQVRFLFGMSPGVDSYSRHFGTINK